MTTIKTTLVLTLLGMCSVVLGQNWAPITSNETFYYQSNEANYISHSIYVDSVTYDGVDSVFHFNRIVKRCDSCTLASISWYDDDFLGVGYQREMESFFGKQVQITNDSIWSFSGNKTWTLLPFRELNESWTWNEENNINAEVITITEGEIFGILDSIKTIELTTGEIVELSKSFGIVRSPSFETEESVDNYELVGIQERDLGASIPDFSDFFSYEIGDILQYQVKMLIDIKEAENYQDKECESIMKLRVLDVEYESENVTVDFERTVRDTCRLFPSGDVFVDWFQDTVVFEYSVSAFENYHHYPNRVTYPGDFTIPVDTSNYFHGNFEQPCNKNLVTQYSKTEDNRVIEYFGGYSYFNEGVEAHTFLRPIDTWEYGWIDDDGLLLMGDQYDLFNNLMENINGHHYEMEGFSFITGLGVGSYFYEFDHVDLGSEPIEIYAESRSFELTAFQMGASGRGEIIPDEILLGVENHDSNNIGFSIYPNPARDVAFVESNGILGEVRILDVWGRTLFYESTNSNRIDLNISSFAEGIYVIELSRSSGVKSSQKLVVNR